MAGIKLNQATINVIDNYISTDASTKIINKLGALENKNVTVTNTGVFSSGKSSLYNALLGIKDGEKLRFDVGATRTTMVRDTVLYKNNIELVDTPGIDVEEKDDEVALNAICASSIIMMVHNIKMGMLQSNEVEWLKKILINFNGDKDQLKNRFIFVNTWIDARMMEKSYQSTVDETKRILFETLGTEVDVFNVSAKLYIQGISNNQQKFIDISNIPELMDAIDRKAKFYTDNYGLASVRRDISNLCTENGSNLGIVRATKCQEVSRLSSEESEKFKVKLNQWNTDFKRFTDLATRYNDVVSKLNNL